MIDPRLVEALHAKAPGWAAAVASNPVLENVGGLFKWYGVEWEVAAHFPLPCCDARVALVRRSDGDLSSWHSIGCPNACSTATYTVEHND